MNDDENDPTRPTRIRDEATALSAFCAEKQKQHAQIAAEFGYAKDAFDTVASNFTDVVDDPAFKNTQQSLVKFRKFADTRDLLQSGKESNLALFAYAAANTANTTVTSTSAFNMGPTSFPNSWAQTHKFVAPPPQTLITAVTDYAAKLTNLNPTLGELYGSIWPTFFGSVGEGERSALLLMRQLFDHLFEVIAPDSEVRDSTFFTSKDEPNTDQVHRLERINFAAAKVKDPIVRDLLLDGAEKMIAVYHKLNMLHTRDAIPRAAAQEALSATQAVIERWVDAIDCKRDRFELP